MPDDGSLDVGSIRQDVKTVRWMNKDTNLSFKKNGDRLIISLRNVTADPVDTILKIELAGR